MTMIVPFVLGIGSAAWLLQWLAEVKQAETPAEMPNELPTDWASRFEDSLSGQYSWSRPVWEEHDLQSLEDWEWCLEYLTKGRADIAADDGEWFNPQERADRLNRLDQELAVIQAQVERLRQEAQPEDWDYDGETMTVWVRPRIVLGADEYTATDNQGRMLSTSDLWGTPKERHAERLELAFQERYPGDILGRLFCESDGYPVQVPWRWWQAVANEDPFWEEEPDEDPDEN